MSVGASSRSAVAAPGQAAHVVHSAAVVGAPIGTIGTAVAQQSPRVVLSFCNARQMTAPEVYIHFVAEDYAADGTVANLGTATVLRDGKPEFLSAPAPRARVRRRSSR